ncbi:16S rRNA (uracil(1498)-N(3))-methyltransferase [Gluconacetobacter entanii]|uniref:Ribosomal RNA small subunit methyltransferase E n=1 Tax=Gluconacetobacter entanii TaxID=108528 RepID=A0ABT3K892_9PROT|nr:16S rRNA (uracil(1498)-N(3))-methyltransferase [Gluconacetobacter entanii]MBE7619127.1 16S rRNA (uracil(1498)-N(3))-methyltransferase [Komagataeibacter sp. FXV2]MCW4591659.1 16S rRNA (uracil(1498)-N(3))-methyltransferase [Gluconacetobacter entanii]MCW4595297.1 16S rRNA (uracil(1498)-N(3))-methyltransferase [Gluconacetobacter entanii]NPC87748.1 16S rRNA (uracil(1498)-N(3))-methyltransferase [Gluconacetobacter entanii]
MRDSPRLFMDPQAYPPMQPEMVIRLEPDRAHYLGNVLRLGAGARVVVFNVRDGEWSATIEMLRRDRGEIRLGQMDRAPCVTRGPQIMFAPLKRDATEMIIRMGTELGVGCFHPVITERTNTHRLNEGRLSAIAREASEQCERLDVPDIRPIRPMTDAIAHYPADMQLFVALERLDPTAQEGEVPRARSGDALLIGPEGGFSAQEQAFLRRQPVTRVLSLGPLVLRADTAAAAGLALMGAGIRRGLAGGD